MAFTTQVFIFVFFPICMLSYYLTILLQKNGLLAKFMKKVRATDLVLIGISCVFYLWITSIVQGFWILCE
jgi:alginate O-acetyltransferase complex protein AlgI